MSSYALVYEKKDFSVKEILVAYSVFFVAQIRIILSLTTKNRCFPQYFYDFLRKCVGTKELQFVARMR
jgi:hypothetical protein